MATPARFFKTASMDKIEELLGQVVAETNSKFAEQAIEARYEKSGDAEYKFYLMPTTNYFNYCLFEIVNRMAGRIDVRFVKIFANDPITNHYKPGKITTVAEVEGIITNEIFGHVRMQYVIHNLSALARDAA